MNKKEEAISKLKTLRGSNLYTTTINLAELYRGAHLSDDKQKEMSKIENILRFIRVLTLDIKSALKYGELYSKLKSNLIKDADLLIASIAISNGYTLLTKDEDFQKVSDMKTDTW